MKQEINCVTGYILGDFLLAFFTWLLINLFFILIKNIVRKYKSYKDLSNDYDELLKENQDLYYKNKALSNKLKAKK